MVVVMTAFVFAAFLYIAHRYQNPLYLKLGLVALAGHVVVAVVVVPVVPYTWDFGQFDRAAQEVATGGLPGGSTVASFAAIQGLVYTIFGADQTNIAIFSGFLAVLIPIPVRSIVIRLYDRSLLLGGLTALLLFLPLPFLLLSLPMRDSFSVLLFFTLLAVALRALQEREPLFGFTVVPLWGMLYLVRPELALVSVLGIVASLGVMIIRDLGLNLSIPSLAAVLGGIGAVGFGLFAELLYSFERVNAELSYRATGGAVYLEGMQYRSWFDFLIAAPGRAIYFQFTPFPLHVESLFHFLAFSATLIVIVLFVSAIRSLYECNYDDIAAVLLVVVYLAGITGYSVINSNFGTNVRHRIVFDFLLIIAAAPVIARWELLVRQWLRVVPGQRDEDNEKQRETQELHGHVQARRQYSDETD